MEGNYDIEKEHNAVKHETNDVENETLFSPLFAVVEFDQTNRVLELVFY